LAPADRATGASGLRQCQERSVNNNLPEDSFMSEEKNAAQDFVRIPVFQRILDNPFILLFIGVVVPAVFYIIWGIMEIVTIPLAQ
jgi:hypothetical protein